MLNVLCEEVRLYWAVIYNVSYEEVKLPLALLFYVLILMALVANLALLAK